MNESGIGGFKEVVFMITGQGAYLQAEIREPACTGYSGCRKRNPAGASTPPPCTVAIMPEAEEVDVELDMNDCQIRCVPRIRQRRTVRQYHGLCGASDPSFPPVSWFPARTRKSQLKNKEKALKRPSRPRLYDLELAKKQNAEAEERRSQIGTGDRSEKIRTYNFPQGRVTEHRIEADPI